MVNLYFCLIRSILDCVDAIYDYESDLLEYVQRSAALLCTGANNRTAHIDLLAELGWETMCCRPTLFIKTPHVLAPSYFKQDNTRSRMASQCFIVCVTVKTSVLL